MSCNVYEEPNLRINVRYSKGGQKDRGEREEKLVDIYESTDTCADRRIDLLTRRRGKRIQRWPPAAQKNPFKTAALLLGLLSLLLIIAVSVLFQLVHINVGYRSKYEELEVRYKNLENYFCQSEKDVTEVSWTRFRCSCYYMSTEIKSWMDSKEDCEKRGAKLVVIDSTEEHDFIRRLNTPRASWIGLQSVLNPKWTWEWQWVDKSTANTKFWEKDVRAIPDKWLTVYINPEGTLSHVKNESKTWICEKPIFPTNHFV